jgi:redox-sensitive bicupin YhaK (pirin superfamily)
VTTPRTIDLRTRGQQHGFIRRMVSPGDIGERIKPFIFLDYVGGKIAPGTGFGFHPHSGIATLTYQVNADIAYEDTTGQKGRVKATGLEWMRAGGGTWHQGSIYPQAESVMGFQLWVSLPPPVEDGPPEGLYVAPEQVPQVGNVRVLLGSYGGATNPIPAPTPMVYLDVVLNPGETWSFTPPEGHTIGWAMVYAGRAQICGEAVESELVVLNESDGAFTVEALEPAAETPCRMLVGCALKHPHPLVLGRYSVHSNRASLAQGEANIVAIGQQLRRDGRL